ncbi:HNH endonuclease [Patescibacteria group bacterium]|nr:HNH endonuclease [Patescibacteria group bacterium]
MRPIPRHWEEKSLRKVIASSRSVRDALQKMGLRGAGGNYRYFEKFVDEYKIEIGHFLGQGWSKNKSVPKEPIWSLDEILVRNSYFSIWQLKRRLFKAGLKHPKCEECGWAKKSEDGRIPIEIDHINGDHSDNRLENLRILCPNCHSLKPTHRGKNKNAGRDGGIGQTHRA